MNARELIESELHNCMSEAALQLGPSSDALSTTDNATRCALEGISQLNTSVRLLSGEPKYIRRLREAKKHLDLAYSLLDDVHNDLLDEY